MYGNETENKIFGRVILDGGSQLTFIRECISRKLGLNVIGTHRISIASFGKDERSPSRLCNKVKLSLKGQYSDEIISVTAVEIPEICFDALSIPCVENDSRLRQFQLADARNINKEPVKGISLLIGADYYWQIMTGEHVRLSASLTALNTRFGWTIHGTNRNSSHSVNLATVLTMNVNEERVNLESIKTNEISGIIYCDPFESLKTVTNKLLRKDDKLSESEATVEKYTTKRCERKESIVNSQKVKVPPNCMPHRAVLRGDQRTKKVTVVSDCPARAPGLPLLNDCMVTDDENSRFHRQQQVHPYTRTGLSHERDLIIDRCMDRKPAKKYSRTPTTCKVADSSSLHAVTSRTHPPDYSLHYYGNSYTDPDSLNSHDMKMLRYSEIPRDISADSLAALKISDKNEEPKRRSSSSEKQDQTSKPYTKRDQYNPLSDARNRKTSSPVISSTGPGPPISYYNYGSSLTPVPAHIKSQSLPNHASTTNFTKNYSCAIFDILRIAVDDFASQLTLLDLPVFLSIQPDELTSCAWNKKNKLTVAPNVVAFSRRFNHVSFWTVQEILSGSTPKQRSEILTHFIRIAKKLYDLNNLHSLFAIISALQSASVYRLSKTWSSLSKKDRLAYDKLTEVFSDVDNWSNLRSHMESLRLPCIPYLGLYLTDLVYIDMAHPHSGGLESQQRLLKMNNILRIISNYQQSDYSHLTLIPHIQNYLNSIRYIEELQKFVEDDQYKLSLRLEPPSPAASSSCSSKESVVADASALASLNLSPAKASSGSLRLHAATAGNKFIPGHRKCRSLGTNIFGKSHQVSSFDPKDVPKTLHLLDDSELEDCSRSLHLGHSDLSSPTTDLTLQASHNTADNCTLLTRLTEDSLNSDDQICSLQGCVRRKTVLKEGRKPTVASWQRYWLQIWATSLAYFSPKSFKGSQRSDFKREPSKLASLAGCQVVLSENPLQTDCFQIIDHIRGNVYKFRSGSKSSAERWCRYLKKAASGEQTPLPSNLMSFE